MSDAGDGCAAIGCLVFAVPLFIGFLMLIYGVAVLVFRNAFGIELPNPFDYLPSDWREWFEQRK